MAVWLRYLRRICDAAALPARFIYVDQPIPNRLPLPRILKRALGSLIAAFKVLGTRGEVAPVVHVNASLYPSTVLRDLPVVIAAALRGCPILLQVHGGRLANLTPGKIPWRAWHWMCRRATCLGIHPGPQWEEFKNAGYERRMRRMYNLVPSTDHRADLAAAPHFLFLGRVVEEKGVREALRVALRLRDEGHDEVRMTIAGEGDLVEQLRKKIRSSPHSEAVSVTGFLEGDALEYVRRQANIFVLPSRHQEGFPFAFLESAERGMACITTTDSAIADVFEPEEEFQPVDINQPSDLYDQMKRMVTDPTHRERIGTGGYEAVQECCTIEAAANRFENLYLKLAKQK
ncbi:glycosyltransferase family 4 protein [Salinibacter pepae]|uniref:glycosyltransferase family 4 protein n=1 Tax=Salinibacter pepae TaxID=3040382 RepID=UPI0021E7CBA4|nr:glycosyltransferase family 4 protein [Salinibacter pepae]